jgi:hypothetical protein
VLTFSPSGRMPLHLSATQRITRACPLLSFERPVLMVRNSVAITGSTAPGRHKRSFRFSTPWQPLHAIGHGAAGTAAADHEASRMITQTGQLDHFTTEPASSAPEIMSTCWMRLPSAH